MDLRLSEESCVPNRILRDGILTSERVNTLSWSSELFYRRLISVVDDFGRYYAKPELLRAACYPLQIDRVTNAAIAEFLDDTVRTGLVATYTITGKDYLEILDFGQERIRARASKFPDRDGTVVDRSNDGYVYLIGENYATPVKIGFSLNPWARAKELTTGSQNQITVLHVIRAPQSLEKELHQLFDPFRKKNEWFLLPEDVVNVLKTISVVTSVDMASFIVELRSTSSLLRAYGDGDGDVGVGVGEGVVPTPDGVGVPDGTLPACPHEQIIALYHELLPGCPKVVAWSDTRQAFLRGRWRERARVEIDGYTTLENGLAWWQRFFDYCSRSAFLTGKTNPSGDRKPFLANLEWLVRPSNFIKVLEGQYHR